MNVVKNDGINEIKFCPSCGHEGHDVICPACNEKMESLDAEVDRISKADNPEKDIFDDATSLEEEQEKEESELGVPDEEDTDL